MTVKEIHVLINLYLQEINSNIYGNVEDEEKDYFFNLELMQYIRNTLNAETNIYKTGFEHTKEKYNSLRQLKRTEKFPVYKHTGNFVYIPFPSDYLRIINSASEIVTFCNTPVLLEDTTTTKHIVKFELEEILSYIDSASANAVDSNFYIGFNLILNSINSAGGTPGFEFKLDDYYPLGFDDEGLRYILLHLLYEEINKSDTYKCYWNFYNGEYYNNTLIIESDIEFNCTTFYEELSSSLENQTISLDSEEVNYTKYNYTYTGEYSLKPNRLLADEEYEFLSNSNFGKSNKNNPISRIEKDFLFVELPKNSMISNIQLKYIKKPRLINLYLNRNTDVGSDVIEIVARKTAETISRVKSNSNTQLIERSNIYNE